MGTSIYTRVSGQQPYYLPGAVAAIIGALAALGAPASAQDLTDARRVAVAERLHESTVSIHFGRAVGSGFVVGNGHWVVTNAHVARQRRVRVRFNGGETRLGRVIARRRSHDLAVIRIDGEVPVPPLPLGDSDDVKVGQTVLAFGSPFGLDGTLTQGIVSARRTMGSVKDLIQTDAAVNPGNSGGPLVDARGRVIGVNTAILSRSGGSQGIGFAIPSNDVRSFLEQVRAHLKRNGTPGRAERKDSRAEDRPCCAKTPSPCCERESEAQSGSAWLGMFGDDFRSSRVRGVRVRKVVPGGPAERAGLRGLADPPPAYIRRLGVPWTGHIVVALDGRPVRSLRELRARLDGRSPGERTRVVFTVGTGAMKGEAVVTLARPPSRQKR